MRRKTTAADIAVIIYFASAAVAVDSSHLTASSSPSLRGEKTRIFSLASICPRHSHIGGSNLSIILSLFSPFVVPPSLFLSLTHAYAFEVRICSIKKGW